MKFAKHQDFDSFLEALLLPEQAICVRLRELLLGNFPELKEKFAYGAPFYHRNSRICFLYPASLPYSGIASGVSFGFNRGHLLSNDHGLLDIGNRKQVAYISLLQESDIKADLFLEMLHEAVLLDDEMSPKKKR
jgi:Domain of unknown function (DU1801)